MAIDERVRYYVSTNQSLLEKSPKLWTPDDHRDLFSLQLIAESSGIDIGRPLSRSRSPRDEGYLDISGGVDTSKPCVCGSVLFKGRYGYRMALVHHAEVGGVDDESNYALQTYLYQICMRCRKFEQTVVADS
jgi:hypothetical protein